LYNQDDLVDLRTKRGIHRLVPGVTGWAQVNGRDDIPIPLKVEYDEYYMNNKSIILDLKIVWMTAVNVLRKRGIKH
jgi:O-antigen biosynthesis protein WbqP